MMLYGLGSTLGCRHEQQKCTMKPAYNHADPDSICFLPKSTMI